MKKNILIGLATAALLSVGAGTVSVNNNVNENGVVQAATKTKKLTHNAYVYNSKGKRIKKAKTLKKGTKVKVYGYKTIKGKKYAHIGKNKYVKAANFAKNDVPKLSVHDTIDQIAKNAKKIKDISKRYDYVCEALGRPMVLTAKHNINDGDIEVAKGQKVYFARLGADAEINLDAPSYEYGGEDGPDMDCGYVHLKNYNVSFNVDSGLKQAAKIVRNAEEAYANKDTYTYEMKNGKLTKLDAIKKGSSIFDKVYYFGDRIYKFNGEYYLAAGEPSFEVFVKVNDVTLSK